MNPTASDVRVDPVLTNMSIAYRNSMYIAEQVWPIVQVDGMSGKYYIFDRGEWFRDEAQVRAPGTASEGGGFTLSDDSYSCEEKAFHTLLADEVRDNADAVLRMEAAKTNYVTDKILLTLEKAVADKIMDTSNWDNDTTLSGTDQWSDYDNSDPIDDIVTGIEAVEDATGVPPNTMVLGLPTWRKLKHHPDITDRMAVTNTRVSSLQILQELVDIDRIYVGKALYNNAVRGASDNFDHVWGKHCWIGVVPPSPALETPSAGYTFVWPRDGQIRGIRRWRDEDHHSDKIEGFMCFDEKITASALGYMIEDAVA